MAAERDRQQSEQADAGRAKGDQNAQMRAARRDAWLPTLLVSGIFLVLGVLVLLTMHFVVRSLYEVRRLTGHQDAVTSVAVTPDGRYVVSGSWDRTVRIWELATGKEVRRLIGQQGHVESVAVTPDGRYIVSGGNDATLRLWELATGEEIRRFAGHEGHVRSVAVTPDGRYVVSRKLGQNGANMGVGHREGGKATDRRHVVVAKFGSPFMSLVWQLRRMAGI
jgi:hypothetical protein